MRVCTIYGMMLNILRRKATRHFLINNMRQSLGKRALLRILASRDLYQNLLNLRCIPHILRIGREADFPHRPVLCHLIGAIPYRLPLRWIFHMVNMFRQNRYHQHPQMIHIHRYGKRDSHIAIFIQRHLCDGGKLCLPIMIRRFFEKSLQRIDHVLRADTCPVLPKHIRTNLQPELIPIGQHFPFLCQAAFHGRSIFIRFHQRHEDHQE